MEKNDGISSNHGNEDRMTPQASVQQSSQMQQRGERRGRIDFAFRRECYGCGLCAAVCPKEAISYNAELLPSVDPEKCIQCGTCAAACPALNPPECSSPFPQWNSFAMQNRDRVLREKSSSGGVFRALANVILAEGGAVCGCIWDEDWQPKQVLTERSEGLDAMMGSKYVQSDMRDVYVQIRAARQAGKTVLFTGTPCQTAAVARYFPKDEGVLLAAVVCHGSISRKIWSDYVAEERKKHGEIAGINMRDKARGWLNYGLKFTFCDGTVHTVYRKEDGYFLKCFTDGLMERERCLHCQHKGDKICADVLLGDGWSLDRHTSIPDDGLGMSGVSALTERGSALISRVEKDFEVCPLPAEVLLQTNARIASPAAENPMRRKFLKYCAEKPGEIAHIAEKFGKNSIRNRLRRKFGF